MEKVSSEILSAQRRFGIIGKSEGLMAALHRALQVAKVDLSALVIGESGTGKESFPKMIHDNSARRHKKYIAVNCGAIPEGTIDSELFGHVKGSFTGAERDHKGYFEEADGGTIFLDEVAEMPLSTQARLLRVLESGEFIKVGANSPQKTNIRVVAATNKNMMQAIKEGKFREDLYYRLSTVEIDVPPLRDRGDDIWLLVRKFTGDFAENNGMPRVEFDETARERIMSYYWPGNVRQLKNIIEQVALFESGRTVSAETLRSYLPKAELATVDAQPQVDYARDRELMFALIKQLQSELEALKMQVEQRGDTMEVTPHYVSRLGDLRRESKQLGYGAHDTQPIMPHRSSAPSGSSPVNSVVDLTDNVLDVEATHVRTLEETERDTIKESLARNGGRRKLTAQELQISERTLYRKIKLYNLD
ncbi:MAG: sigma-54-dependent Fis family transcriptional regulator [Muribaculaceae bacterium]|nr:sigma-54-dependent Fis family transcriptional regulator [Muribaculaceae bacterium]